MRLIDADRLIELLETNEELYGYLGVDDIKNAPTACENRCEDCMVYDKCHGVMQYGTKCFRPKGSAIDE